MLFKKRELQDLVWGESDILELISDETIDTTRWSIIHEIVFMYAGKFYKTTYSIGATEYQNEKPFEDDPDEIEIKEVIPVSKTITVYV